MLYRSTHLPTVSVAFFIFCVTITHKNNKYSKIGKQIINIHQQQ